MFASCLNAQNKTNEKKEKFHTMADSLKDSKGVRSALDPHSDVFYKEQMFRPLRIEYQNAWYHVMNRGRRAERIYNDQNDYEMFIIG